MLLRTQCSRFEIQLEASSAEDGTLPCFMHNPQKLFSPKHCRWITAREKFAAMGFPVTWDVADSFGCQVVHPSMAFKRPHSLIGNSMVVPNCAGVILATLLSVKLPLAYGFTLVWHIVLKGWCCIVSSHVMHTLHECLPKDGAT